MNRKGKFAIFGLGLGLILIISLFVGGYFLISGGELKFGEPKYCGDSNLNEVSNDKDCFCSEGETKQTIFNGFGGSFGNIEIKKVYSCKLEGATDSSDYIVFPVDTKDEAISYASEYYGSTQCDSPTVSLWVTDFLINTIHGKRSVYNVECFDTESSKYLVLKFIRDDGCIVEGYFNGIDTNRERIPPVLVPSGVGNELLYDTDVMC